MDVNVYIFAQDSSWQKSTNLHMYYCERHTSSSQHVQQIYVQDSFVFNRIDRAKVIYCLRNKPLLAPLPLIGLVLNEHLLLGPVLSKLCHQYCQSAAVCWLTKDERDEK